MRRFDDPRFAERLATVDAMAAPYVEAAELAIDDVPLPAVPSVRIALLRRVVESDLATAASASADVRARLATHSALVTSDVALELELCRFGMDLGFGISLAVLRLGLLDPTLADLDRTDAAEASDELTDACIAVAGILANDTLIMDPGSTDRRLRLLTSLERIRPGMGARHAFDPGDPFGATMRTLAETDDELSRTLGLILPIATRATSVLPDRRQRAAIAALVGDGPTTERVRGAVSRVAHQLVTAPLRPRGPGFVTVRPSDQRLARAATWLIPSVRPRDAADLLGEIGLRMGTSGMRGNQARDAAIAGTCAALLGELGDDAAVASLARMQVRVRNRTVRKQVDKGLASVALRRGTSIDNLIDAALPSFGLDAAGRRNIEVGSWTAEIEVGTTGRVWTSWSDGTDGPSDRPPTHVRDAAPGDVADIVDLADEISKALADDARRLERLLAFDHGWPMDDWRRRFSDHPLGRLHAERLIWRIARGSDTAEAMVADGVFIDAKGSALSAPMRDATVSIWHPVEGSPEDVARWRDAVVGRGIEQPFQQAFRDTYRADRRFGMDSVLDRRFADRPLAYGQMRALMLARGWSAPMLGPFDQGDRSVGYLEIGDAGLRAEFESRPAGLEDLRDRVDYVRSGAVRFTTGAGSGRTPVLLVDVPPRLFSEVLRDVALFTSVPDILHERRTP